MSLSRSVLASEATSCSLAAGVLLCGSSPAWRQVEMGAVRHVHASWSTRYVRASGPPVGLVTLTPNAINCELEPCMQKNVCV